MDKNVSGVDLDELMKAREELDKERGVETDPNLYSDYNPNRNKEETENADKNDTTIENNYDNITKSDNPDTEESLILTEDNNTKELSDDSEIVDAQESDKQSEHGMSEDNLSKFNAFAAFEVKENAPVSDSEHINEIQSDNKEAREQSAGQEKSINEDEINNRLEQIDDAEDLETLLNDILDDIEADDEEIISETTQENHADTLEKVIDEENDETKHEESLENLGEAEQDNDSNVMIAGIDIEPKFDNEESLEVKEEVVAETASNDVELQGDDISENIMEIKSEEPLINTSLDDFVPTEEVKEETSELIDNNKYSNDDLAVQETEEVSDDSKSDLDDIQELYTKYSSDDSKIDESNNDKSVEESSGNSENQETDIVVIDSEQDAKDEEKLETSDNNDEELAVQNEETKDSEEASATQESQTEDEKNEDNTIQSEDDESSEEKSGSKEAIEEDDELEDDEEEAEDAISDLDENDIGRYIKRANDPEPQVKNKKKKSAYAENAIEDADAEVITDYSQLRDILEKQFQEAEEIDEEEFKRKHLYKAIDDFKFIDEITTNEFKTSDNFSYILGKNEDNETVYGNFKEHCNLAVFGKNDSVTNSMLNSLILSLCLKNSYNDLNFVLLDSDINSPFEVYNKSSYLYFNRIAKTNKEILDTLIEVSKEVDNRYQQLASIGVKNIESYNEVAKENNLQTMPYVIVVFNNYTSASQATDHDKINACLYQILKYGRIAGFYALVCAKVPIEITQVNYSLSSRISFRSDEASTYTVGAKDVEYLPGESDAVYFNIATNNTEHIKVATVTDVELDLIIKDLEE